MAESQRTGLSDAHQSHPARGDGESTAARRAAAATCGGTGETCLAVSIELAAARRGPPDMGSRIKGQWHPSTGRNARRGAHPRQVGGVLLFKDTRTPVSIVFENLEAGMTIDEITEQWRTS
ncbi:MAG: hypothetical protein Q9191_008540, partial [Dirinaria sp. TL-2023a]